MSNTDLRDRMIEVLRENGQRPAATAARLADSLIAELRLHSERGRLKVVRYVSDWMPERDGDG